jgi:ATP-binding cassette subfamily B protein
MPSQLVNMMSRENHNEETRPRSVVPGRQRWDVPLLIRRPKAAELVAARLRDTPWIEVAEANPVTGRLLVRHETPLSAADVAELVRDVVAQVGRLVATTTGRQRPPAQGRSDGTSLIVGATTVAVVAACGTGLVTVPVVGMGAVITATVLIVRRGWRTTSRALRDGESTGAAIRPLSDAVCIQHRRKFVLASGLSVTGQLVELTLAVLTGKITLVLLSGTGSTLARLGLATASSQLWFWAGAVALATATAGILSYSAAIAWRGLAQNVEHDWRTKLYAHAQQLELRHLEQERTTRVATTLTEDVRQLGRFLAGPAHETIQLAVCTVALIPAFLVLAPSFAWIAFLPMPVIAWMSFRHHDRAARDYATASEDGSLLNSQIVNSLQANATVKSFAAERYEIDRVTQLSQAYRESNRRVDRNATRYSESVRMCSIASLTGTMVIGGRAVLKGTLPFDVFSPLVGLPQQMLGRLPRLGDIVDQYQRTQVAWTRLTRLLDLPTEHNGDGHRLRPSEITGEVVLDRVSFAYPGRPLTLDALSLRIPPGRVTGIVGATGAGKTTMAKLLMRFHHADSGQVLLDGQDVRGINLHDLRNAIGFVAQDTFLFDGTIGDNIRYGSFAATQKEITAAARCAEADRFIEALPHGYDTPIGERGFELSGGQRQRLSLARAILKNAPILVLDEATSAVDNETESAIQHALQDFARGRTLVLIAHRLSTIRNADLIYVLDTNGVVAEHGTHDELLDRDSLYASLWRRQVGTASTRS